MLKRTLAALLWFYAGWYLGAMIVYHLGLTAMLGPIIGLAAAALFAGDPRRIIWVRPEASDATSTSAQPTTTAPDPA